jgi:hypothetical protein
MIIVSTWYFFSLVTYFGMNLALPSMSITTPASFQIPFAWNIIFHPFTFNLCIFLPVRCVSWKQETIGYWFLFSNSLCLLIGELRPFAFKVFIERYAIIPVISLSCFFLIDLNIHFFFSFSVTYLWDLLIFSVDSVEFYPTYCLSVPELSYLWMIFFLFYV